MTEVDKDIWIQRNLLDKERRDYSRKVMAEFDKTYHEKVRALQARCSHPHEVFTGCGPTGLAWFHCTCCGRSRTEDEDL